LGNFEIPPKLKILVFLIKNKKLWGEGEPKHVSTIWILNTRIFHMPFSLSKNCHYMWNSAYPFVQNDIFLKVPYISWVWDFVEMYLTHLGTKIWSPSIHIYSKEWFFGPKTLLYPSSTGKKLYFSNIEHYDLAIDKE
jgi:hypothetical protein